MNGRVEGIWRKRSHRGPMDPLTEGVLVAGEGLAGSADRGGRRQVTLIEAEVFEAVAAELGRSVDPAGRRANVLLRGIPLAGSRGKVLALGEGRIRILGETRPCERMDEWTPGLRAALSPPWRGGTFGEVIRGGKVAIGDTAEWIEE